MTILPGTSSTGRGARGRARPETSHPSALARADGVLVLYAEGHERSSRSEPKDHMSDDAVVAPLRAERDAALEEVAYLREQIRSMSAYHAHLLEEERGRMFDERTQLATELAALREDLQRRAFPGAVATSRARGALAATSDEDSTSTR